LTGSVSELVASIEGCIPRRVESLEAASDLLRSGKGDLALIYVADPTAGAELVRSLEQWNFDGLSAPIVVLTERDDPQLHLRLVRLGVIECLSRPLNLSRLALLVDMTTLRRRLGYQEISQRRARAPRKATLEVGDCLFDRATTEALLEKVRRVAPLSCTVLLTGETGSGKTHLARLFHDLSRRKDKPFLVVHCGALTPTLLNSEMFGHVRGAFTGADSDRSGKFSEVGEGTILLDEIDCIPLEAQAHLLRVVEERVYEPVGSTRSKPLCARIVVTANRPLHEEVAAGRFRADLFYRLNVVNLKIPPLRSRPALIRPLVDRFVQQFGLQIKNRVPNVSRAAMEALEAYDWPGNIRELRNVVERAIALCPKDTIGVCDLPEQLQRSGPLVRNEKSGGEESGSNAPLDPVGSPARSKLEEARCRVEREQLLDALHRHNNNRTSAAADLGISRVTLYKKLNRYGLT
jgi:DNA-binding NtrC family response regulator